VFGECVGWVALTIDLPQVDAFGPRRLLYPQGVCVEVPEFAKTLARADANCRAGVGPDAQRQLNPDILEQSLVS